MESLVSRLRPCILSNGPIFLPTVFKCLYVPLADYDVSGEDHNALTHFKESLDHVYTEISKYDIVADPADYWLTESWLYIDSVHSDPHDKKEEGLAFSYAQRYFAVTLFFSYLAILVIKLFSFIRHLSKSYNLRNTMAWNPGGD